MPEINTLPLDMFDDDEPGDAPEAPPAAEAPVGAAPTADTPAASEDTDTAPTGERRWCQWCGVVDDPLAETCPTCGGHLTVQVPAEQRPVAGEVECQWCDAKVPPDTLVCPKCGSRLADPSQTFYGLNAPLPGTDLPPLRVPYGYPYAGDLAARTTGEVIGGIISSIIRNIG